MRFVPPVLALIIPFGGCSDPSESENREQGGPAQRMAEYEMQLEMKRIAEFERKQKKRLEAKHADWGEPFIERYENGQKKSEGRILGDGTKVGLWTWWLTEGKKEKEGQWTGWSEEGKKQYEGAYYNGERKGQWTEMHEAWYASGQKKWERKFNDRIPEGRWTEWYENGQKLRVRDYKNGEIEGRWMEWNEDGNLRTEKSGLYRAGVKISDLPKKYR